MDNEVAAKLTEAFNKGKDGVLVSIHYQVGDELQHYFYRGNSMSTENALASLKHITKDFEEKEVKQLKAWK